VAVDPDTGAVEVLNFVAVSDAGRVIERESCEGQISAALTCQINKALFWDAIPDPLTGIPLTFDFVDDKTATALDVPEDKNQIFLIETIDANGPYGAHGMGEPGVVGSYASIINAVNNAINKWIDERPASPITILRALGKA
jgi:CO/xanthine dehydrogenase Mo-binding subunit